MNRLFRRPNRRPDERGQSLVEFALILPIFLILIIGLMEFSVAMSAQLNVNYASRDAALIAAETGGNAASDCVVLQRVDDVINGPSDQRMVTEVRIFHADRNGNELSGEANVYTPTGNTTCSMPDGTSITVRYRAVATGYPFASRCTFVAGCGTRQLDTVGVSISYSHRWITPLASLVNLSGSGFNFTKTNAMRMEPIL
jgi:Flp pilus assembly protein TadG